MLKGRLKLTFVRSVMMVNRRVRLSALPKVVFLITVDEMS